MAKLLGKTGGICYTTAWMRAAQYKKKNRETSWCECEETAKNTKCYVMLQTPPKKYGREGRRGGAEDEDEARKCLRQSGNRDEVRVSRERPMNCKASGGIRDAQKRESWRGKKKEDRGYQLVKKV